MGGGDTAAAWTAGRRLRIASLIESRPCPLTTIGGGTGKIRSRSRVGVEKSRSKHRYSRASCSGWKAPGRMRFASTRTVASGMSRIASGWMFEPPGYRSGPPGRTSTRASSAPDAAAVRAWSPPWALRRTEPRNASRGSRSSAANTSVTSTFSSPRPPSRYLRAFPSHESSSSRRPVGLSFRSCVMRQVSDLAVALDEKVDSACRYCLERADPVGIDTSPIRAGQGVTPSQRTVGGLVDPSTSVGRCR